MKKISIIAMLLVVMVFTVNASASVITFIQSGSGTYSLGNQQMGQADFTITAYGDTTNRQAYGSGFFIDNISADINIGSDVLHFITPTRFFNNTASGTVGFSRAGISGADLFNGPTNDVFKTWDMLSSIGPITGVGYLMQWTLSDVVTDKGVLAFASGSSFASFQAIVGSTVPEPATMLLFGAGLAGLGIMRKRMKV